MAALAPAVSIKDERVALDPVSSGLSAGGALKTGAAAAIDWSGRIVDLADAVLSFPSWLARPAKNIPLAGPVITTVGNVFSAVFQGCLLHIPTLGVGRWIQTLRRFCAVRGAVSNVLKGDGDIESLPVNSLLASISDQKLRQDLGDYFKLTLKRQALEETPGPADPEKQREQKALDAALAKYELKLARRAEFIELRSIAGLEEKGRARSKRYLERRAELAADFMINRVEKYYKNKVGLLGSEVTGEWVATKNEGGRAALKEKIYQRLLTAYQANRESLEAKESINAIKSDLDEAFLVKSLAYQGLFISVLGVLWSTGTLPQALDGIGHVKDRVFSFASQYLIPAGVQEAFTAGVSYLKTAMYVGAGWLGLKGVAAAKTLGHDLGFGHNTHAGGGRVAEHGASNHTHAEVPREAARELLPPLDKHAPEISKITGESTHSGEARVDPHLPKAPHVEPRIPGEHIAPHERIHVKTPRY